uniref:Uncharacterized protein n=1 Tax=Arundo donax TaxID=35708 RepID=A0A0A9FZR0_ARUDO
MNCLKILS